MASYDAGDVKVLFSLFDADRNGKLGKEEIKEMLQLITGGWTQDDEIAQVMQLIDTNKDDVITIDEFEVMITKYVRMAPIGVKSLFNSFDLNGDGFVDKNEFNQVIKDKAGTLDERKINYFRKILTKDDNGKVSYQEFIDSASQHYRNYVTNRD